MVIAWSNSLITDFIETAPTDNITVRVPKALILLLKFFLDSGGILFLCHTVNKSGGGINGLPVSRLKW